MSRPVIRAAYWWHNPPVEGPPIRHVNQSMSQGGHVLVADLVRQLVTGKGFLFHHTGEQDLTGMEDRVHIWELRWESD